MEVLNKLTLPIIHQTEEGRVDTGQPLLIRVDKTDITQVKTNKKMMLTKMH